MPTFLADTQNLHVLRLAIDYASRSQFEQIPKVYSSEILPKQVPREPPI